MALPFLRLAIEPIPFSSRRASLANLLPRSQWDSIRRYVYRRSHYHCKICGREGKMYCHETWEFNEQTGHQYLMGFECLCHLCHKTKHYFFAHNNQVRSILFQHFLNVNHVTEQQAVDHLMNINMRQRRLNQREWIINYGEHNWQVPATTTVEQRRSYAAFNHPQYA